MRIHLRALPEHDAVLIDQINLSVGREPTLNHAGRALKNAIQRDRRDVRLLEGDHAVAREIEALPIENGLIALLIDRQRIAGCCQAGATETYPIGWSIGSTATGAWRRKL